MGGQSDPEQSTGAGGSRSKGRERILGAVGAAARKDALRRDRHASGFQLSPDWEKSAKSGTLGGPGELLRSIDNGC